MLAEQLLARGIKDDAVLKVMGALPRQHFVQRVDDAAAYEDRPLPIGSGQTISQPYIVALMTQLLALKGDEKILEIGTGSGYQTAILAKLSRNVHSVERIEQLALGAQAALAELEIGNVQVHIGDGSLGWPDEAPFDGIMVTAAAPKAPKALLEQLAEDAYLVIPVGKRGRQKLQCWQKSREGYVHEDICPVAFVPLLGAQGWQA